MAVIGCGAVSQLYYVPALERLEAEGKVKVVGLIDPSQKASGLLQKHFPTAKTWPSIDQLDSTQAQLLIVASPPRFHAEQTITALRRGLSVLCEKPLATTSAEGLSMVDAASKTGRLLAVGLIRRYLPATEFIRALIHREMLGTMNSISIFEGGPFAWPIGSTTYFHHTQSRGGVLLDIGAHVLDLLIWWLGEPLDVAYEDDAVDGIEVNCRVRLRFRPRIDVDIRLSRDWARPNQYVFRGSNGWIKWEANEANRLELGIEGSPHYLNGNLCIINDQREDPTKIPEQSFESSFIKQIENVLDAMANKGTLHVSGNDALPSLRLIEACYHQRVSMEQPWLDTEEREALSRLGLTK